MLTPRADQRLEDYQVAAFLATSAYDAPLPPLDGDMTTRLDSADRGDRTAMMPGVVGVAGEGDATRVITRARPLVKTKRRLRASSLAVGAIALAAVLGIGLYFAFSSSSVKPPVTTTTEPPTTTTTVLAGTAALKALESQVLAGESAGNVDAASGQVITRAASQAQSDYTAGNTSQAISDLQLASSAISNGISNHTIGPVEGQLLQSDLGLLAGALNLSSAVTTTTTTTSTTTTTTVPGPPFGIGSGNGIGN